MPFRLSPLHACLPIGPKINLSAHLTVSHKSPAASSHAHKDEGGVCVRAYATRVEQQWSSLDDLPMQAADHRQNHHQRGRSVFNISEILADKSDRGGEDLFLKGNLSCLLDYLLENAKHFLL